MNTVFDHYQYTSLAEYHALLSLYRVRADRGKEGSRLYQTGGLIYLALDADGKPIGRYIKAGSFLLRPTLARLEEKFELNKALVPDNQRRVKTAIDWTLAGTPPDWNGFQEALGREGIDVVIQAGKAGEGKEVYFVDQVAKAVFSGAGLGANYLLETFGNDAPQSDGRKKRNWSSGNDCITPHIRSIKFILRNCYHSPGNYVELRFSYYSNYH